MLITCHWHIHCLLHLLLGPSRRHLTLMSPKANHLPSPSTTPASPSQLRAYEIQNFLKVTLELPLCLNAQQIPQGIPPRYLQAFHSCSAPPASVFPWGHRHSSRLLSPLLFWPRLGHRAARIHLSLKSVHILLLFRPAAVFPCHIGNQSPGRVCQPRLILAAAALLTS